MLQSIPQAWQLVSLLHWLTRHARSSAAQLLAPRSVEQVWQAGDDKSADEVDRGVAEVFDVDGGGVEVVRGGDGEEVVGDPVHSHAQNVLVGVAQSVVVVQLPDLASHPFILQSDSESKEPLLQPKTAGDVTAGAVEEDEMTAVGFTVEEGIVL